MDISKNDWKLFKEKLPAWQEGYMERLINEFSALLNGSGPASDKFWALEERIKQERRKPGVLVEMSKSEAVYNMIQLIRDGAITTDDLKDFSDELKDTVLFFLNR